MKLLLSLVASVALTFAFPTIATKNPPPIGCVKLSKLHKPTAADVAQPWALPDTGPVRLLTTHPGETRFATGILVELKDGRRVLAVANGGTGAHQNTWHYLQQKYPDAIKRALWWGEMEIQGNPSGGPGTVMRANETSGTFKDLKASQPENNVAHLVNALQALNPKLIRPEGAKRFQDYGGDPAQEHLSPVMMGRHKAGNVLGALTMGMDAATVSRNYLDPDAPLIVSDAEVAERLKPGSSIHQVLEIVKDDFRNFLGAMENDGLISPMKRAHLKAELEGLLTGPANTHLVKAFRDELVVLRAKVQLACGYREGQYQDPQQYFRSDDPDVEVLKDFIETVVISPP